MVSSEGYAVERAPHPHHRARPPGRDVRADVDPGAAWRARARHRPGRDSRRARARHARRIAGRAPVVHAVHRSAARSAHARRADPLCGLDVGRIRPLGPRPGEAAIHRHGARATARGGGHRRGGRDPRRRRAQHRPHRPAVGARAARARRADRASRLRGVQRQRALARLADRRRRRAYQAHRADGAGHDRRRVPARVDLPPQSPAGGVRHGLDADPGRSDRRAGAAGRHGR